MSQGFDVLLDYSENIFKRWWRKFSSQPHQLFFTLGFLQAFLTISTLLLTLTGYASIDTRLFHTINIGLFMPVSFFLGFLLTVIYRFLGQIPFIKTQYMPLFWFCMSGYIITNLGIFLSSTIYLAGLILLAYGILKSLVLFINTYNKSTQNEKFDVFWLIFIYSMSLLSAVGFAFSHIFPALLNTIVYFTFYIFFVPLVFIVSQKMLPSFYMFYFNETIKESNKKLTLSVLFCIFLLFVARSLDIKSIVFIASSFGSVLSLWLFIENKVLFRKCKPILFILQAGIMWLVIAFASGLAEVVWNISSHLQIHLFGVGFIGTMLIGFGTRVTLGHSNQKIIADKLTTAIFILYQLVIILRIITVFYGEFLIPSAICWCVILGIWLYRYLPDLSQIRNL